MLRNNKRPIEEDTGSMRRLAKSLVGSARILLDEFGSWHGFEATRIYGIKLDDLCRDGLHYLKVALR